jgi:uncharacterized phage protein (TIGR01671 family)
MMPPCSIQKIAETFPSQCLDYIIQFTGVQDKHGVDIYEKDIVNICYTSGGGQWVHDGIYVCSISPLEGVTFTFDDLDWVSHAYNQYPSCSVVNSKSILRMYSNNQTFLCIEDKFNDGYRTDKDVYPFNNEKVLDNHSRYIKVIGNLYENPEFRI